MNQIEYGAHNCSQCHGAVGRTINTYGYYTTVNASVFTPVHETCRCTPRLISEDVHNGIVAAKKAEREKLIAEIGQDEYSRRLWIRRLEDSLPRLGDGGPQVLVAEMLEYLHSPDPAMRKRAVHLCSHPQPIH